MKEVRWEVIFAMQRKRKEVSVDLIIEHAYRQLWHQIGNAREKTRRK